MSGIKILVDTNVIINHLAGDQQIETILENSIIYISSLTYAELLSGNISEEENEILIDFLKAVHIIHTNNFICENAALLRKKFKVKLPNALIASTGLFLDHPIVTFDHDFDKIADLKIIKLKL